MKKIVMILALGSIVLSASAQKSIEINLEKSIVTWTGSNLFKFNKHYGTVNFKSGKVFKKDKTIVGGEFVIDMHSIINTDGKYNKMLVWHLKNRDFFEVEKHPTSQLKITKVKYVDNNNLEINANLTIKGITHPIAYKTQLEKAEDKTVMKSKFIINRARWEIKHDSPSFFKNLKDDAISDAIEFEVMLMTK